MSSFTYLLLKYYLLNSELYIMINFDLIIY